MTETPSSYGEALSWLYGLQRFGVKLGLENMQQLVAESGINLSGSQIVHVAGTNGKGSTCAMLESIYRAAGLRVAAEVFADRAYEPDGTLASRRKPGAVIHDSDVVVARAVRMVTDRTVVATDGSVVPLEADTVCVHGDTPGSDVLAARIRAGFERAGVTVQAIGAA